MATLKLRQPSERQLRKVERVRSSASHSYSHEPQLRIYTAPIIPLREDNLELVQIELKNWGWWQSHLPGVWIGYNSVSVGFEDSATGYATEDEQYIRDAVVDQARPDGERATRCDQLIGLVCTARDKECLRQRFAYQSSSREAAQNISTKRCRVSGEYKWQCTHTKYIEWVAQAMGKVDAAYKLTSQRVLA